MVLQCLPCPVCGGESFIESTTQGGLICVECGTVSNQVEMADDEFGVEQSQGRTNIAAKRYKRVTDEQFEARRSARSRLKIRDNRGVSVMIEGLGVILKHMTSRLIAQVPDIIGSRWTEINNIDRLQLWGIPTREGQRQVVFQNLPPELRRRLHSLNSMLEDRRLGCMRVGVVEESPQYIFMHDWLCAFFASLSIGSVEAYSHYPLLDVILIDLLGSEGTDLSSLSSIRTTQSPPITMDLSSLREYFENLAFYDGPVEIFTDESERRVKVRSLFIRVIRSENLRVEYFEKVMRVRRDVTGTAGMLTMSLGPTLSSLPSLTMETLLSVILIGIRNSGVGVLPIHVLNWITRGDLPYFSAHTCLPSEIDRIEYYWLGKRPMSIDPSLFMPRKCPTVSDMTKRVNQIRQLGVAVKPLGEASVSGLLKSVADFLGIGGMGAFFVSLANKALDNPMPLVTPQALRIRKSYVPKAAGEFTAMEPPCGEDLSNLLFGDVTSNEFAAMIVLVGMKLVTPCLHTGQTESSLPSSTEQTGLSQLVNEYMNSVWDAKNSPASFYTVKSVSGGFLGEGVGTLEWWDQLQAAERTSVLKFLDNERFTELRPSIVEELRQGMAEESPMSHHPVAYGTRELLLGHISSYSLAPSSIDLNGLFVNLLRDVMQACEIDEARDLVRLYRMFQQFEKNLFR